VAARNAAGQHEPMAGQKKSRLSLLANRDKDAFLLSHTKAPLREEKRDAIAINWHLHELILSL
jgi:hypothetical protein